MKNQPHTFHLSQMSVMFDLHKCSCRSDPGFYRGHSSYISSISGDHRPVLPEAGVDAADFGGWTEAGGGGGGRERHDNSSSVQAGVEVAPHCSLWKTVPQTLANQLRQIYGTITPSTPPPLLPTPQPALRAAGPPTRPQCLFLCALWPCAALWSGSSREECAKHTAQRRVRKYESDTQSGSWFSVLFVPQTLNRYTYLPKLLRKVLIVLL